MNVRKKKTRKARRRESFQVLKQTFSDPQQKLQSKYTKTYPPNETQFDKTKGRAWNLIQWQEFRIHLTKFDSTTRKLNRQYDIQPAVTKTGFFPWYFATKCDMHDGNTIFGVDSTSYPISLMLHDCIAYDINMTLLWWMGVAKSRYQFISSYWGFLRIITPWFVSNIGNTSIRI